MGNVNQEERVSFGINMLPQEVLAHYVLVVVGIQELEAQIAH
jgi:hypothetical protein